MEKLIAELRRLYLPDPQHPGTAALEDHLRAATTLTIDLATHHGADAGDGTARALVLHFPREADEQHWTRLCDVANALQQELKLPAPAVSVNGSSHFSLWLSFAQPVPLARLRQFHSLLQQAYCADQEVTPAATLVEIPPCLHRSTGLWAAFINPAMGASLAEDLGLEMPPPVSAQAAFLQGLASIDGDDFARAFTRLHGGQPAPASPGTAAAPLTTPAAMTVNAPPNAAANTAAHTAINTAVNTAVNTPASASAAAQRQSGLLLRDATLEDIVAELHKRHIEPTLRHLLPR